MDLFGSRTRTRILLYLAVVEESYSTEIATALDGTKVTVQRILGDLEKLGIVASRLRGRTRLISLDKTWYGANELRALLKRIAEADRSMGVFEAAAKTRRRPRRPGKPL